MTDALIKAGRPDTWWARACCVGPYYYSAFVVASMFVVASIFVVASWCVCVCVCVWFVCVCHKIKAGRPDTPWARACCVGPYYYSAFVVASMFVVASIFVVASWCVCVCVWFVCVCHKIKAGRPDTSWAHACCVGPYYYSAFVVASLFVVASIFVVASWCVCGVNVIK
jgi:hypothetical protein